MKSRWMTHKGKRIFHADFSGFGQDINGLKAEIEIALAEIEHQPPNSVVVMVDIRSTVISAEAASFIKQNSLRVQPQLHRTAIVTQATGFKKVIFDAIARFTGRQIPLFDDPETAKEWLVQDQ